MSTIANLEQAEAWDGEEGARWAEHAERYDAVGARVWKRFLDADLIAPADRVLDIGCGNGGSTCDAARAAAEGSALGVDLSAAMLARALARAAAEGVTNVRFEQADAQVHSFERDAFDLAISRFGAMFFGDPVAAFTNIAASLRPGGRLAMLSWREIGENEWLVAVRNALAQGHPMPEPPPDTPGPFGLARPDSVRRILTEGGFHDVGLEPIDEVMRFGADADDAFGFLRTMGLVKGLTEELDEATRQRALDALRARLAEHESDDGVGMRGAAWLITARRA